MALFFECMQQCARKALDTADIVRDGDITPTVGFKRLRVWTVVKPFDNHVLVGDRSAF